MARCSYCGAETNVAPVCKACDRRRTSDLVLAATELTKARLATRAAEDQMSRLTDACLGMPKPSPGGDLTIEQAQQIYKGAIDELNRALSAYDAALKR